MATIFLTSSPTGPLDGSRPVIGLDKMNCFAARLHMNWKFTEPAKCLIIAAAPAEFEQNDEMRAFFYNALRTDGFCISYMDILDFRNKNMTRETLQTYDVIFLGGGHVPTQNAFFREIGLREKLSGFQGIIVGISAGSMNSADVVYSSPEVPGEAVDPNYKRFIQGLGLTNSQIIPHYQMAKDYTLDGLRLYEDVIYPDSYGHKFYVLTDGAYLLRKDGRETIYGESYLLVDGTLSQLCGTDGSYEII